MRNTMVLLLLLLLPLQAAALTISPPGGMQGQTLNLTIHEPGIVWEPGVQIDLGPDIQPLALMLLSDNILHAILLIEPDAALGTRDLRVFDSLHSSTASGVFLVTNGLGFPGDDRSNALTNPGFETGDLTGWTPATWSIDTTLPHGGIYDAYDPGGSGGGGLCIFQGFAPIDSDLISSFTFWIRQPDDLGIAQVAVYYQSIPTQYGVAFTNDDNSWTFQNQTSLILHNQFVTGIHVCGFGGGMPTADDSWIDDFILEADIPTATAELSFSTAKSLY